MARATRTRQEDTASQAVATVVYSAPALDQLGNPGAARAISSAATMLGEHPLAGPRLHGDIRELIVSFGQTGYVALYRYLPVRQEVRILAIRHQRELHYRP